MTAATFIERGLPPSDRVAPPGDKDDAAVLPYTEKASDLFAGRNAALQPGGAGEELLPGLTLTLEPIGQILDECMMALGDLKLARGQGNWPLLEAAATRLATLSNHAAKTVQQARPRKTSHQKE